MGRIPYAYESFGSGHDRLHPESKMIDYRVIDGRPLAAVWSGTLEIGLLFRKGLVHEDARREWATVTIWIWGRLVPVVDGEAMKNLHAGMEVWEGFV